MAKVIGYHRPTTIGDALEALGAPGNRKVILAGGTVVNADTGFDVVEVVDIQALGLGEITAEGDLLRWGATVTLQDVADDGRTPATLAGLARTEAPSTLRTLGTIGGLVASRGAESELLAGMLAFGAKVTVVTEAGSSDCALSEVLETGTRSGIISAVTVETGGTAASAHTGRTPGDRPIVAAVARRAGDGSVRLALSGVAVTPILVEDVDRLDPPGDFRGSSAYRKHLAGILAERVLAEVG